MELLHIKILLARCEAVEPLLGSSFAHLTQVIDNGIVEDQKKSILPLKPPVVWRAAALL